MTILVLGDAYVEVHSANAGQTQRVRLGGLFHAARAFQAIQCPFVLGCFHPEYLTDILVEEATRLGSSGFFTVGMVQGAPNVVLVREPKEAGDQGYDILLRDERKTIWVDSGLRENAMGQDITDILLFPSPGLLNQTLDYIEDIRARVHVDIHYDVPDISALKRLSKPFDTIFCSTSAPLFRDSWNGSVESMRGELIPGFAKRVVLKENRGGSRLLLNNEGEQDVTKPAHLWETVHSVGVGDCFDAVFLGCSLSVELDEALAYASYISGVYASAWENDVFVEFARKALKVLPSEMANLQGISLPWEDRPDFPIYIAAPDFENVDREPLERLVAALRYHNFYVRLPVRENGLAMPDDTNERKDQLFKADIDLLNSCPVIVAVLLYNDPGTLLEIGLAAAERKPVIVYDPYRIAENLMLCKLPKVLTNDLEIVVGSVFEAISSVRTAGGEDIYE